MRRPAADDVLQRQTAEEDGGADAGGEEGVAGQRQEGDDDEDEGVVGEGADAGVEEGQAGVVEGRDGEEDAGPPGVLGVDGGDVAAVHRHPGAEGDGAQELQDHEVDGHDVEQQDEGAVLDAAEVLALVVVEVEELAVAPDGRLVLVQERVEVEVPAVPALPGVHAVDRGLLGHRHGRTTAAIPGRSSTHRGDASLVASTLLLLPDGLEV